MASNEDWRRPLREEPSILLAQILVRIRNMEEQLPRLIQNMAQAAVEEEKLMIPQEGQAALEENKNCIWSDEETLCLVAIRASFPRHYRGPVWKQVSNTMYDLNFRRSPEICRYRWSTLQKWYKKAIQNGNGRLQPIYQSLLADLRPKSNR